MSKTLISQYESQRALAMKRLSDAVSCAKEAYEDPDRIPRMQVWHERLDSIMTAFTTAHLNLICEMQKTKGWNELSESLEERQVTIADDLYMEFLEIKNVLIPKQTENNNNNNQTKSKIKLPTIKIPVFSGNLKEFPGFIDLFNSLVHQRSDCSNIEKFQHLVSSLSGEAVNVVRAFSISEANYQSAYDALNHRYSNKRYLAFLCWEQVLSVPSLKSSDAPALRRMLDTYNENLSMLKSLGLPTTDWDFVLFHSLLTKIDQTSRDAFELQTQDSIFPKFKDLQSFLESRCTALERAALAQSASNAVNQANNLNNNKKINNNNNNHNNNSKQNQKPPPTMLLAETSSTTCVLCNGKHGLYLCPTFLAKTPSERSEIAKQNQLCLNCLRGRHSTVKCLSAHTCKTCNRKHNTLLHFPPRNSTPEKPPPRGNTSNNQTIPNVLVQNNAEEPVITPVTSLSSMANNKQSSSFVLLATAEVEVKDSRGNFQRVRILLDPGSQSHIITNSCARRLGLTRHKSDIPMLGIGEVQTASTHLVHLEMRPIGQEPSFNIEAVTLDKICGEMPTHSLDTSKFQHIRNLKLADERFQVSRPIDILIGGELFPQILLPGKVECTHAATAINTIFGFILMGKTQTSSVTKPTSVNLLSMDSRLDVAVQKFWDLDTIPAEQHQSPDDLRCEEIYQKSHTRDAEGRYIVKLPFRDLDPTFSGSYDIALRRFMQSEKRLLHNKEFYEQYKEHIMEYESTGQMEPVPPEEWQSPTAYYIPHHAVVKPGKLRVVYDASTQDKEGKSLNDTLLTGCKLQADISSILLRFRLHPIVFSSDIRQMYLRIMLSKEHHDYQRILFRCSPSEPVQEYRLNRVTFGVSSAPFLAIRTMHQLAQDEQESFPAAAKILTRDLYVDDVVTGCQNITEALELQQQLIGIMAAGGFELRKWSSNQEAVLQNIPEEHKATPGVTFDSDSNFVKVLGLAWNAKEDIFNYQVNQISRECTKRTMLSELARIYDPIGLLTPLTFLAKHLILRLWLLGTAWDEPVPEDIKSIWVRYIQQLPQLAFLHIPRRITRDDSTKYQLHGYCDASESGYAAAVYLRSTNDQNQHHVTLVSAKSRVAPTKRTTLPRLELCGASLLADLMDYVLNICSNNIEIDSIHAWSDSMIVLAWIASKSTSYKAFIGNRIANIQRKIPTATWAHVPGKQNPADCASRGTLPEELVHHDLWWSGPAWLSDNEAAWPEAPEIKTIDASLELKTTVLHAAPITSTEGSFDHLIKKFSSLRKIQRIVTYCKRFVDALRKNKRSGHLIESELHDALMVLVKSAQETNFSGDIKALHNKKGLSKPIKKLNPFMDDAGILRVGGRLARSDLAYEAIHPALLPRKHQLTKLIIQCVHNENLHPGLQTMHYLLLQKFWILSPRRVIRQVLSDCYQCFRVKPVPLQPKMADLPRLRIMQTKAFQSVGVDYVGPFNILMNRHRGARTTKAYLCLFVCFATKALHLELASDMSSEAFLAALRRFIARRGRCNIIHSDCGTNFKGAQSQLQVLMQSATESERIQFRFNPPGSPHFGGLWEAGVKSVKTHLYRVIGSQTLTYEEFNTLLTQVESVLNSRPLCPLSTDPNDLSVLTPGHFLTLAPLTTVPTPNYTDTKMNRLTRWQLLQRMHQDFWSRWHSEYLTTLTQRLKWNQTSRDVIVGQLVVIKDETQHPLRWRFGRITELYLGRDGIPRSASIKTAQGTINRPLVKLCPLPLGSD